MLRFYSDCRDYFLLCAKKYGAPVESYILEKHRTPSNEELATDVASIGKPEAPNVIVISSGIHGVELPLGSALQGLWLHAAREICKQRDDVRFVFVHALNPFGAAYGLRTDQDNIDPNRNFLADFNAPPKTSQHYLALADAFNPTDLNIATLARAWKKMLAFGLVTHSTKEFRQALAGGQYEFPNGMYNGGTEPSWTHKTWRTIAQEHVIKYNPKSIWHVDAHSGAGLRGVLQLMVNAEPDDLLHKRVANLVLPENIALTNSSFAKITGDIVDFWPHLNVPEGCTMTPLTIEVGTTRFYELDTLHAMITRNALKVRYNDDHPAADRIKQRMWNAFTPPNDKWLESAVRQGWQFWDGMIRRVGAPHL